MLLFDLIASGVSSFNVRAKSCPNCSAFLTKPWLASLDILNNCIIIITNRSAELQLQHTSWSSTQPSSLDGLRRLSKT